MHISIAISSSMAQKQGKEQQSAAVHLGHTVEDINKEISDLGSAYINQGEADFPTQFKSSQWQLHTQTDSYTLYTSELTESASAQYSLPAYKFVKTFTGVKPIQLCQALLNVNSRSQWDSNILRASRLEVMNDLSMDVVDWVSQFPPPYGNRKYLFLRKWKCLTRDNRKVYAILTRSRKKSDLEKINTANNSNSKASSWSSSLMNMVSGSVEYVKNAGAETEVDFVYSLVLIEASPEKCR